MHPVAMASPSPRLTARPVVLTSQHGYDQLRPEIRSGLLEPLRRGAYVPPVREGVDRWQQREADVLARCRAVAASLRSGFAFSHETAAALRDWQAPVSDKVHVVQRYRVGRGAAPDIVRHHDPDLGVDEIVHVRGLPVTAPERTVVDCALAGSPNVALAIVDAGLRALAQVTRFERELSIERQHAVRVRLLADLARRGPVRHVRRAREVLAQSNGLAEYGGESWLRWLALVQGLPVPELQVPVEIDGTTYYLDMMWRGGVLDGGSPVVAEYDGVAKYGQIDGRGTLPGEAVVSQTDREQRIVDATGARFLRFTKRDRRDPNRAARRLLGALPAVERRPRPTLLSRGR